MADGPGGVPETVATPPPETGAPAPTATAGRRAKPEESYASGARVLSIGIASTGIFTFAYLATASHVLDQQAYGRVSLCWA